MLFGKKNKEKKLSKQGSRSDSLDRNQGTQGSGSRPVLGVKLGLAVKNNRSYDGIPIPAVVRQCVDYVESEGLEMEGIYRVSAPITRLDELEKLANSGGRLEFVDPHDAAGLLKRFLRQLPEHVLRFPPFEPGSFESIAETCVCKSDSICTCETASKLKEMLSVAPKENFYLIAYVFLHAKHVILKQKENKMTLSALGVLLQAMLSVTKNVIRIFILNSAPGEEGAETSTGDKKPIYFFDQVPFKRYIKPLTVSEITSHPPETFPELTEEITKQQYLLEEINDQVLYLRQQNLDTKPKEQEMWDVQQGITILKRKLRTVSRDSKDEEQISSVTEPENASICDSGPRLEKQLLNIQKHLVEEIAEEQRQISELTNRLQELQADITSHDEQINSVSPKEKSQTTRPKLPPPPPPKVPILDVKEIDRNIPTNGILENLGQNCDECHRQESRKQVLVEQITKIRDDCAQLRAQLEDSKETQKTFTVDAADDFGASAALVTKL